MQIIWKPSPNYSGNMGSKTVIVVHWWDLPEKKPSLMGTVNWLCNPAAQVSAHYVVSGTTVYNLVKETDVAWHARDANSFSIGIEVDPNTPPGTYETVSQLCREIAARHLMSLPWAIKPHREYVNTSCPGTLDLERIKRGTQGAQGGADDMTFDQVFDNCFITLAHRWPSEQERSSWRASGLEPYTWVQRFAPNPVVNDRVALEQYQNAREKAGAKYPGGAAKFASDRLNGGDNFQKIMDRDIPYYLDKERRVEELLKAPQAPQTPAITPEQQRDIKIGQSLKTLLKEAQS